MRQLLDEKRIHFGADHLTVPCRKTYLKDTELQSLTSLKFQDGRAASKRLQSLFGSKVFTNPKDEVLLSTLFKAMGVTGKDLVLDFFAGSGSTYHAVQILNSTTASLCGCILVQLPENLPDMLASATGSSKQVTQNAIDYLNAAGRPTSVYELCVERARKVGQTGAGLFGATCGFRMYRLKESNFTPWDANGSKDAAGLEKQLAMHIDHIRHDRTKDDMLYEILLKAGYPLTTRVEEKIIEGKRVFCIAEGLLIVCLETELTLELIRAIAELKPERVVMLDAGFAGND